MCTGPRQFVCLANNIFQLLFEVFPFGLGAQMYGKVLKFGLGKVLALLVLRFFCLRRHTIVEHLVQN